MLMCNVSQSIFPDIIYANSTQLQSSAVYMNGQNLSAPRQFQHFLNSFRCDGMHLHMQWARARVYIHIRMICENSERE